MRLERSKSTGKCRSDLETLQKTICYSSLVKRMNCKALLVELCKQNDFEPSLENRLIQFLARMGDHTKNIGVRFYSPKTPLHYCTFKVWLQGVQVPHIQHFRQFQRVNCFPWKWPWDVTDFGFLDSKEVHLTVHERKSFIIKVSVTF